MKIKFCTFFLFVFFNTSEIPANEKIFEQRFEVAIPARGAIGSSPRRTGDFEFKVPSAYTVVRDGGIHGASIVHVNFGGLTEVIPPKINVIDRGVKITWELKNEKVFPIAGRKAFFIVRLKGIRTGHHMHFSQKYASLRARFVNDFYYQGRVAESVNRNVQGAKIKFADQSIYLGQALMVFATEMAVLRDTGDDVTDARARIKTMLDTIDELDRKADKVFGGKPDELNGFFTRDDIEGSTDPRLGSRFAVVESDWQNPDAQNSSPSGDQIFGLMNGLFCVQFFSGDAELIAQSRAISSRLYNYASRSFFVLKLPDGEPTRRGSDMRWLASLMHGLNKATTGDDLFSRSRIEIGGLPVPLTGIAAFWDSPSSASTVQRLAGKSLPIPIINEQLELNSFALHILLMALATSEVWDQQELEGVAVRSNHHLSALLYAKVHEVQPQNIDEMTIQRILDACPNTGPRASVDPSTGWARDNRWVRCTNIFEAAGGDEEYNGVDWLILHNLHQLVYVLHFPRLRSLYAARLSSRSAVA